MRRIAAVLTTAAWLLALPGAAGAATITPDVAADDFTAAPDGSCSLREAVQAASDNAAFSACPAGDAGTDTIVLTSPSATPYVLSIGLDEEDANAQGDLDYEDGGPLVIRSTTGSIIRATAIDRVIDVGSGGNLTLEGLALDDGDVSAVAADDDSRGGNLRATGTNSLTLSGVTVRDGVARDGGGGIFAGTGTALRISGSTIVANSVSGASGGSSGGGVFALGSSQVIISRTTIAGNEIQTNALGNMKGGGIRATVADGATLEIADSEILANHVEHTGVQGADQSFGGGVSIASQGVIRRSLIRGNTANATGTTVESGGGLHTDGGTAGETLTVVNTTIYDNTAGDASNDGDGGGAHLGGNVAVVFNQNTFGSNSATDPAGGDHLHRAASSTAPVTIRGNIISSGLFVNTCAGLDMTSAGFNMTNVGDSDCDYAGIDGVVGIIGIDAGGPQENGGEVETIGLQLTSLARNFVPAGHCFAEGTDARGFPRPLPVGGACDAGAYELHTCDGANISDGTYFPCALPAAPVSNEPASKAPAKKCKKPKKKKGKGASAAAKKKKKGCKKKKKK